MMLNHFPLVAEVTKSQDVLRGNLKTLIKVAVTGVVAAGIAWVTING